MSELYGDEYLHRDEDLHPLVPSGWIRRRKERMAKHNEPLLLRKAVKVKVDGEERELAAGTEVSAEVAKSLGLAKGKGGVIAAPQ